MVPRFRVAWPLVSLALALSPLPATALAAIKPPTGNTTPPPATVTARGANDTPPAVAAQRTNHTPPATTAQGANTTPPPAVTAQRANHATAQRSATSSRRAIDVFRADAASAAASSLRSDGERFAAWQRPNGDTVILDARQPHRPRTVRPPTGFALAAVGGGRIVWARTATASEIRPTESALVTADAATGSIGTAVRFIATFGSGPLCPAANATYAGITDAGTAGAIVTCQNTPPAAPWRFSVDPTTGVSTAPHFAPSELLGKVWAWNADVTGIQLLACDGVAATPAFADPNPSGAVRNVAYEPPFGAAPRWRHDQLAPQPGAQLITCGRSRPTILERSGTPRSWQFGGTQLSWLAAQSGGRTTASLYDLRKARLQTRVRISTRRSTVTVGHIADRLLIQTTARATRHTPATSHIRVYTAH